MLGATFSLSVSELASDVAVKLTTVLIAYFWQRFSLVILSFLVILKHWSVIKSLSVEPIILTSMVEVLVAAGLFTLMAAFAQGPLGLAALIVSLQPLWVILISWLLGSRKIKLLSSTQEVSISKLFLASLLVISGLFLIRIN
jgi:hypothetical protein